MNETRSNDGCRREPGSAAAGARNFLRWVLISAALTVPLALMVAACGGSTLDVMLSGLAFGLFLAVVIILVQRRRN